MNSMEFQSSSWDMSNPTILTGFSRWTWICATVVHVIIWFLLLSQIMSSIFNSWLWCACKSVPVSINQSKDESADHAHYHCSRINFHISCYWEQTQCKQFTSRELFLHRLHAVEALQVFVENSISTTWQCAKNGLFHWRENLNKFSFWIHLSKLLQSDDFCIKHSRSAIQIMLIRCKVDVSATKWRWEKETGYSHF